MIQDLDTRLRPFAPVIVMAVGLVVFIRTLMPGIAFGDWGEMQVVPHVLGIAHPTGYPTYVLLAWATELIPIGSVAFRANLLSAVCISAAMGLVTAISLRLAVRPLIAMAAGLAFGAVGTVWAAATVAEVNPLHALFAALILYVALDWEERPTPRNLALGGLLIGLALGNHLLTVVIAPFVAVFVLWTGRAEFRRRPGLLIVAPAMVLLGLAVYLYIPIRAAMDPPLAYNHPKTLDGVLFLVTGEQFRGQFGFLSGDGPAKFLEGLPDLAGLLAEQATPILPIAGVIGLGLLVRRRPAFGLLCVAVLIGSAYAYSTYLELEHYLLVPFLVLALGVGVALEALAGGLAQPARVGSARLRGPVVVARRPRTRHRARCHELAGRRPERRPFRDQLRGAGHDRSAAGGRDPVPVGPVDSALVCPARRGGPPGRNGHRRHGDRLRRLGNARGGDHGGDLRPTGVHRPARRGRAGSDS